MKSQVPSFKYSYEWPRSPSNIMWHQLNLASIPKTSSIPSVNIFNQESNKIQKFQMSSGLQGHLKVTAISHFDTTKWVLQRIWISARISSAVSHRSRFKTRTPHSGAQHAPWATVPQSLGFQNASISTMTRLLVSVPAMDSTLPNLAFPKTQRLYLGAVWDKI